MKNQITINGCRFLAKGIKDAAGKYYPAWYSRSTLINGREAVTVYAKSILSGLPAALAPQNDSDMRTDYFEKDRTRFYAGSAEFTQLCNLIA